VNELADLALHLKWASRHDLDSPSSKALRVLIRQPSVLDLLERLVNAERERLAVLDDDRDDDPGEHGGERQAADKERHGAL
jgi:hypothetical protein